MNMGKIVCSLWVGIIFCVCSGAAEAYVMPPEQLIEYMQDKCGVFKTLIILQKTVLADPKDGREFNAFEEKIWVKAPGFFKSQVISGQENGVMSGEPSSSIFRQLLMANSKLHVLKVLAEFGIDIESSGYARLDGVIVYSIGASGPGGARLLLNKETFFPMLLEYEEHEDSGPKKVSARFEDYREISGGWYPFKIVYSAGKEINVQYTILDLQANMPLNSSLFEQEAVAKEPPERDGGVDDAHLKEAINALKKKYR